MDIPTLDKCPGYNLYIGGFIALRRPQALKHCNITHIVSVLDWKFDDDTPLTRGYQHLHIPVDDVEDENLLEWFPRSNAFIQEGLDFWKTGQMDSSTKVARNLGEDGIGSGVLIHCAMGKSRSATVLLAYLLWSSRQSQPTAPVPADSDMIAIPRKPLTVVKALELLRQGRPIAEPNEGFMDQLHMYEDMGCPSSESEIKHHKLYRRWMNKRSVEESLRINQAPEMENILFEDESDSDSESDPNPETNNNKPNTEQESKRQSPVTRTQAKQQKANHMSPVAPGIAAPDGTAPLSDPTFSQSSPVQPQMTLKCRKCRHTLATTPFILAHEPPPHRDPSHHQQLSEPISSTSNRSVQPAPQCAHIFLHPLSWMRSVLAEGQMEGRLTCPNPRCGTNVGKFAWTGLRCSCGGWVTPGFGIIRGKVDEAVTVSKGAVATKGVAGGGTVRMPPAVRKGNL